MPVILPVQLARLYKGFLSELSRAFQDWVRGGQYILGKAVEQFEEEVCRFLGASHAVGCKSGTHALQLALLAAGVRPGDEVVTVANTYYATAEAIKLAGAEPVFCDIDPATGLLDVDDLPRVVTPKTRAILPVHLYGFPAPLADIRRFARPRGLWVIEDCAHAFGSRSSGVAVGADAALACLSFYPTKSLGGFGDGGMVLTTDRELAEALRRLRYYADAGRDHFHDGAVHARLDGLQAALLSVLLRHFGEFEAVRRRHAAVYRDRLGSLANVRMFHEESGREVSPYVFPVLTEHRDALIAALKREGIVLQVHYPVNLHRLPRFGGSRHARLPHTERHNAQVVSLPTHPSLLPEEVERIAGAFWEFLRSV
jgi:dTDP-4-amino-4,6-dideoxygalactose transaminase